MVTVILGSARGSYGNTARGDQAGGKEVATQNWYKHSKGWRVFRAKNPAKRAMLAYAMKAACANNNIGYSQPDRLALYTQVKDKGFDPAKATAKTNTDCSGLVRVCCKYAGINVANFSTANEASYLMKTGEFTEMTGSKYTTKPDYLGAGDILVTKVKGHTVIAITRGTKYEGANDVAPPVVILGDRELANGAEGDDVKELQSYLIQLGYDCGKWGADGEFGDATELAVREFQLNCDITVDGVVGNDTVSKIRIAMTELNAPNGKHVKIVGGNCFVRKAPSVFEDSLGVLRANTIVDYAGETSVDGWLKVSAYGGGWVSGKYGRMV